jgi:transcriptional regulator with XRE-family HTH domain
MQRFGEKLRTLRKRHGITQMHLASEFGYTTNTYIGLIEKGKKTPSLAFVLRVADLFNVTTDQLVRDKLEIADATQTIWTGSVQADAE